MMFKDSNVFEFTNFLFKMKYYNNTEVYSVDSNYLFIYSRGENMKKTVKTILWLNLLSIY